MSVQSPRTGTNTQTPNQNWGTRGFSPSSDALQRWNYEILELVAATEHVKIQELMVNMKINKSGVRRIEACG